MIPPSIREGGARLSRPPFWMHGIQYEADLLLEFTRENIASVRKEIGGASSKGGGRGEMRGRAYSPVYRMMYLI